MKELKEETEVLSACYEQLGRSLTLSLKDRMHMSDVLFYLGTYHIAVFTQPENIKKSLFNEDFCEDAIKNTKNLVSLVLTKLMLEKMMIFAGPAPRVETEGGQRCS